MHKGTTGGGAAIRIHAPVFISLAAAISFSAFAESIRMNPALSRQGMFYSAFVQLDDEGKGSIEFAGGDGRLRIERRGGRFHLDVNRDGVIDDADGEGLSSGDAVGVRFELGGARIRYPLRGFAIGTRIVRICGCMILDGEWNGRKIRIYDMNVNGRFDEQGVDGISVDGELLVYDAPPLGSMLDAGGRVYEMEVSDGGLTLVLEEHPGPYAAVRMEKAQLFEASLRLANARGHIIDLSGENARLAVPGEYRIVRNTYQPSRSGSFLSRIVGDTPDDMHGFWQFDKAPAIVLAEGENVLTPGPPFELGFSAIVWGDPPRYYHVSGVWLAGRMGERYDPDENVTVSLCKGQQTIGSSKMEFG